MNFFKTVIWVATRGFEPLKGGEGGKWPDKTRYEEKESKKEDVLREKR